MRNEPAFGDGLSRAPTEALLGLLRAVHRGQMTFPVTRSTLIAMGYGDVEATLSTLVGLDERGLRAVLVAVIAERKAAAPSGAR